jgi:hypothetical protein
MACGLCDDVLADIPDRLEQPNWESEYYGHWQGLGALFLPTR